MLRIQDRAEYGKDTKIGGEEQCTEKMSIERGYTAHAFLMGEHNWGARKYMLVGLGGGDTAHKLLMAGTIGVWTPHNIERT